MNPFTDIPSAVAGGTCAVCGRRPGTVRVVASDHVSYFRDLEGLRTLAGFV